MVSRRWVMPSVRLGPWEVVILLTPVVLLGAGIAGVPWPAVTAAAVAEVLVLLAVAGRRGDLGLAGPLYFYDLVRLARRGRTTLLRCFYAAVLLGVLYLVYADRFPQYDVLQKPFDAGLSVSLNGSAEFGRGFVTSVLLLQGAAVLVLTPAYLAGAVAEEKEQGTLELLFTTHLSDREIVLGKLLGRLTHLGVVLLAGLPILMTAQLFGGVDLTLILGGTAAAAFSLLSVGSMSILFSVLCRRVITAVLASYAVCTVISIGCLCCGSLDFLSSPVLFTYRLSELLSQGEQTTGMPGLAFRSSGGVASPATAIPMLYGYGLLHGLVAVLCAVFAVLQLRVSLREGYTGLRPAPPPPELRDARVVGGWDPAEERRRPVRRREAEPRPVRYERAVELPPIGDRPLLWKEMYHGLAVGLDVTGPREFGLWHIGLVVTGAIGLIFFLLYGISPNEAYGLTRNGLDGFLRGAFVFFAACWCVCVAFRSAAGISSERDRRTLETLFTLPLDREEILHAKWLGSILRYRLFGYLLAGVWCVGVCTGSFHPLSAVLLAVAALVHVGFLATLGVCLSLLSRNSLWSIMTMALMLLLLFTGPALLLGVLPTEGGWETRFYEIGLNPVRTWWSLGFAWDDFGGLGGPYDRDLLVTISAALAGLAAVFVLAGALWLLASRRFRREVTRAR